jgi:hypothetical protein
MQTDLRWECTVRHLRCLVLALCVSAACAGGASSPKAGGTLQSRQWVLVQSPPKGEMGENTFPPIYTWKRVRTFDDAESCSNFRVDMLWDAESTGSRAMLEQVSSLHCLPAAKLASPTTGTKSRGGR